MRRKREKEVRPPYDALPSDLKAQIAADREWGWDFESGQAVKSGRFPVKIAKRRYEAERALRCALARKLGMENYDGDLYFDVPDSIAGSRLPPKSFKDKDGRTWGSAGRTSSPAGSGSTLSSSAPAISSTDPGYCYATKRGWLTCGSACSFQHLCRQPGKIYSY
jgi:hypothetical protein